MWVSVAGALYIILTKVAGLEIDLGIWNEALDAIGVILVAFGIVTNHSNKGLKN
jgi:uncharacterized membrane protein